MTAVHQDWSPARRQRAADNIARLAARKRIVDSVAHPAELARSCDPDYVITPAIDLVSRKIEQVLRRRRKRLMITAPPQEFKSRLCAVWTPLRALQLHPDWRVMLLTYADGLAEEHSLTARSYIREFGTGVTDALTGQALPDKLGLSLHPEKATAHNWRIAEGEGGLVAAGRDATITGRKADLIIVDDPFKNMQEADSEAIRQKVLDWYRSVATTRLSAGASVILIQCMTGDTPVLRPDGSQTPLRDIRPGDEIATYEDGTLSTSVVRNWANQGQDDVLCIRMMSGRTVRANARHPFLTSKDGVQAWKRAAEITSGDRLVALDVAHGSPVPRAPQTDAMPQPSARACAHRTTSAPGGRTEYAARPGAVERAATSSCGSDTASTMISTMPCSPRRADAARSAAASRGSAGCRSTGTGTSASITSTTAELCAACSATTVISCSGAEAPRIVYAPELTTWSEDEVSEVIPAGREDVFDIEVERTENFIANGLVSHNTRWNPKDLAGVLLDQDRALPRELREWHYINIPAVSHPAVPDALERAPDVPLESARGRTREDYAAIRRTVGERIWNALYQGVPSPPEGGLFAQAWFDAHRLDAVPERTRVRIVAVDPSESGKGDEAGIVAAALLHSARMIVLPESNENEDPSTALARTVAALMMRPDAVTTDLHTQIAITHDVSEPLTSSGWARAAVRLALETDASYIFVEAFTAGLTYVNVVKEHIKARIRTATDPVTRAKLHSLLFRVKPWHQTGDAVARSALLRQAVEVGTCAVVGQELATMEAQAILWNIGQHQPDRVAACVIAHDRLMHMLGQAAQIGSPVAAQRTAPPGDSQWGRKVG